MKTARQFTFLVAILAIALASLMLVPAFVGGGARLALTSAVVRAADGESFTLSAPVKLLENPGVVLEGGTLSMAASSDGKSRSLDAVSKVLANGRASLQLDGATIAIDQPVKSSGGDGGQPGDPARLIAPLLHALAAFEFETLALRRSTLILKGVDGESTTLGDLDADFALKPKSSLRAKGTFERRGQKLAFDATLSLVASRKNNGGLPLNATITGDLLEARLEGHLQRGAGVQLAAKQSEVHVRSLKHLFGWLGSGPIAGPGLEKFDADGPLEWSGRSLAFEQAAFSIDGNAATGSLNCNFLGPRLSLEGTLAFGDLELAPYAPSSQQDNPIFAMGSSWLPFLAISEKSLMSFLPDLDADLRISASKVSNRGTAIGRGAATLSMKANKFNASVTDFELDGGGQGEGQLSIDTTNDVPRYEARGEFRGFDFARIGPMLLGQQPVLGIGTLSMDLSATGRTTQDLLAALDGKVRVDIPENAGIALDVDALISTAKSATSSPGGWPNALSRAVPVDTLTLNFTASAGILTTGKSEARTGQSRLVAAGTVNLGQHVLDLELTKIGSRGGQGTTANPGGTETVRIKGPWSAPEIRSTGVGDRSEAPHVRRARQAAYLAAYTQTGGPDR